MTRSPGKHRAVVFFSLLTITGFGTPVWAHQPVMDMAPRWEGGYGFQVRQESRFSDTLLDGDSEVANPSGRKRKVSKTWFEGVYTFKREVRASFKLPYVEQSRTVVQSGMPVRQEASGVGDLVLGVLLKRYENRAAETSNIAITPSIRLPTGSTKGDFPVGDGSTDFGISFSMSMEKANLYQYYDVFYWKNGKGKKGIDEGDELGLDINIGWHPYHNNLTNSGVFAMVDFSARHQKKGLDAEGVTGGTRVSMGPVLVLYRQNMMFRAEYKVPVYEKVFDTQVAFGPQFNVGIGFVF